MQHFYIERDIDNKQKWSQQTTIICPYCEKKNTCYMQLRENKCKYCKVEMPFPSVMFKEIDKRIQYHFAV